MSIKENIEYYGKTTKTVSKNVAEFADAAALAAVSGYSVYEALQPSNKSFWYRALLVAGVLIALQAFVLLVRHFNRPVVEISKKK